MAELDFIDGITEDELNAEVSPREAAIRRVNLSKNLCLDPKYTYKTVSRDIAVREKGKIKKNAAGETVYEHVTGKGVAPEKCWATAPNGKMGIGIKVGKKFIVLGVNKEKKKVKMLPVESPTDLPAKHDYLVKLLNDGRYDKILEEAHQEAAKSTKILRDKKIAKAAAKASTK
jgi:hypothetical protein